MMKINEGWRPIGRHKLADNINQPSISQRSFSDMMAQQEHRVSQEQLQQMAGRISNQALLLSRTLTVRELRQYKQMVRMFLEETARRGVRLKDTNGFDRRGRAKRYKLLEEIDGRLLEMADELLESEQGRIQLLAKIGELQGLLINYFF